MRVRQTLATILGFGLVGFFLLSACDPARGQDAKPTDANAPSGIVEKDVPYADGGDQRMLDLYLPKTKGFTTVVFTFGGGWHSGGRQAVTAIGEQLQRLGYGCALLSHRLAGRAVTTFVGKGCDHMGVVRSLLEDRSPVREHVLAFLKQVEDKAK
jgi:acetyl esterase/lipase